MKNLLKYFFILILIVVILLVIVVNFSGKVSKLKCSGEITEKGVSKLIVIYLELTEYKIWVNFWSKSKGGLRVEIPSQMFRYYDKIDKAGETLLIYKNNKLRGAFSKLSKALTLDMLELGVFEGECKLIY